MPLTSELLERLERCWADQNVPWLGALRPGASDAQLAEILAPFDHAIPTELRLWWGWHNGASVDVWIANDLALVSAEQAARDFLMMRDIARDAVEPDKFWSPRWLPVFGTASAPTYAVECVEHDTREAGRIIYQDSWPNPHTGFIAAASLGDVIHQLCEAYDAGLQRWDPEQNRWLQTRWGERRAFAF